MLSMINFGSYQAVKPNRVVKNPNDERKNVSWNTYKRNNQDVVDLGRVKQDEKDFQDESRVVDFMDKFQITGRTKGFYSACLKRFINSYGAETVHRKDCDPKFMYIEKAKFTELEGEEIFSVNLRNNEGEKHPTVRYYAAYDPKDGELIDELLDPYPGM